MDIIKRSDANKRKAAASAAAGATNLATAASADTSSRRTPSPSSAGPTRQAATSNGGGGGSKLVFGLSSRTNRSKHDEYAEQRLRKQRQQPQQPQQLTSVAGEQQPIGIVLGPKESGATMSCKQPRVPTQAQVTKASTTTTAAAPVNSAALASESRPRRATASDEIRARSGKRSGQPDCKSAAKSGASSTCASGDMVKSSGQPTGPRPAESNGARVPKSDKRRDVTATTLSKPASVRARSRSPERIATTTKLGARGRRNSLEEDLSTMKIELPNRRLQEPEGGDKASQQQPQQPAELNTMPRTQFNIRPPPQMSISSGKSGSVVNFAKARIYEKPAKPVLPTNNLLHQPSPLDPISSSPWSSALDDHGHIPKSISSGLRPPKQVMVAKARKEWEGGEPFTKCKSRKRLAAQANKKLFPGTWSMTSVVATQQLHLQQALAQASSASRRSNAQETDLSVKVLTRGSVLERIQQYERVPKPSSGGSSPNSTGSPFSSNSSDYDDDGKEIDLLSAPISSRSSSSSSSSLSDLGESEAAIATKPTATEAAPAAGNKKAHYRARVSSLQNQQDHHSSADQAPLATGPTWSGAVGQHGRRPSIRRRSSVLGSSKNSTTSLIPKFYHPNGKPNTYEIEVQKRQIVSCFESFPERLAQLEGPNAKRHFLQIALACNFSEYYKIPLNLYVKRKLETCPQLFVSLNIRPNIKTNQRKTSTISLDTNGSLASPLRRHSRSNSVVLSQPVRSLTKAASIDSTPQANGNHTQAPPIALVSCEEFLACWRDLISRSYDNAARFVHLLTFGQRNHLLPEDFVPLVQSIIDDHPGLKFLRAAPDFHMRYIQTVVARIYFCINRNWTGKLSLQELRKSNLLAVLQVLSQEVDINQITDYFSYEHFYVIYCKFWNLDQDHDLLISKEDLARHNDAAISSRIIERIFSNVVSRNIHRTGKMGYSDFVWFLIAEEDKKHPRSIEYWFRLMDLDGDGFISMYEMEYFYYEQMKRLELMNIEPLPFLDSACQILDLVNPREKNKISLADLKRTRMATIFFDTFINLEKYLEHESREFVSTRDVVQGGVVVSDWDRYAADEYENLVVEETTV